MRFDHSWLSLLRLRVGLWLVGCKPQASRHSISIDLNATDLKPQVIATPKGFFNITPQLLHFVGFDGTEHWVHGNGDEEVRLPRLARVEIADLGQVVNHRINHVHQTTSHVIDFVGGGVLTVLYDDHGCVCELTTHCLSTKASTAPCVITILNSTLEVRNMTVWIAPSGGQ